VNDVFLSYAHADAPGAGSIVEALTAQGLSVWFDDQEVADFESITRSIERASPTRRHCSPTTR
jgi:hypothetical protein